MNKEAEKLPKVKDGKESGGSSAEAKPEKTAGGEILHPVDMKSFVGGIDGLFI